MGAEIERVKTAPVPAYVSSRWAELGFSPQQARAYYQPEQAPPQALQALEKRGLLRLHPGQGWLRVPAWAPAGGPQVRYRSAYQTIELYESGDSRAVFLNGTIQLESRETHHHNEMMVALPLSVLPFPRKVLILGGGLGMGARVALLFPEVESIQVVEIDPDVLRLSQQSRSFRQINGKSLLHPKVTAVVADAFEFVAHCQELYDLIVFDCDLTATRQGDGLEISDLVQFFSTLPLRLAPGGGITTRIPIDEGYMELVEAAEGARSLDESSDLDRARALVAQIWPQAVCFEFLSVYCGRELFVLQFPTSAPGIQRRLDCGSPGYQQVLDDLFG
jgi:hypothetical protein